MIRYKQLWFTQRYFKDNKKYKIRLSLKNCHWFTLSIFTIKNAPTLVSRLPVNLFVSMNSSVFNCAGYLTKESDLNFDVSSEEGNEVKMNAPFGLNRLKKESLVHPPGNAANYGPVSSSFHLLSIA